MRKQIRPSAFKAHLNARLRGARRADKITLVVWGRVVHQGRPSAPRLPSSLGPQP